MEIVQILTLKFKFLVRYLPKFYFKKVKQKEEEDWTKKSKEKAFCKALGIEAELMTDSMQFNEYERVLDFYAETGRGVVKVESDKEKEINDLLNETKDLAQKIIALMQSVINTLCGNRKSGDPESGQQVNEECLEQLSKLFHYGVKYFVTKAAIHRSHGKNYAVEIEEMEKTVKFFIETFVRMDLASFAQIMDRQIPFLCKCISKSLTGSSFKEFLSTSKKVQDNEFLLKIPQYMRDELIKQTAAARDKPQEESMHSYSAVFAYILAKHLIKKFKNIGGYNKAISFEPDDLQKQKGAEVGLDLDSQKYSRTLNLFKVVMDIFSRLEGNEDIYAYYFNFIVLSAKYSRKAKSFFHYFSVIKSVSRVIKDKQNESSKENIPKDYPPKEFVTLLPGLLTIILKVKQECAVLSELLTEICQYLPVNFRTLVEYLPVLIKPFMDCVSPIKIASNIAANAIKSFEQWFAALSHLPELLNTLYTPIFPEFIMSLHKLFTYQHYTPSIHRILSRVGGKSRLYMIEKEAYTKS